MDVSSAVTAITGASGPVTEIGLAVIGVLAVVATFRYIRRVF